MKKKIRILIVTVAVAVFVLGGCQFKKENVTEGGDLKILFSEIESGEYYENWAGMAQKRAEEAGAQMDVLYAEGSVEEQVEHMKKAVEDGYDVIICSPVSVDIVTELEASAKDIPIVFVNNEPSDRRLKENKYIYVASDEITAGEYQGEYVLEKFADKDEINVAILKGTKGSSGTYGRTNGAKRVLEASGKKINYVFEDYADYNSDKAQELFGIFLKEGVSVDCVLCNNDNMAIGAIAACNEANVNTGSMLFLGVDASADGCQAIKDGKMALTVYQSTSGQSAAAVEAAIRLANGKSIQGIEGAQEDGKHIWVPFERVDSSNVTKYSN